MTHAAHPGGKTATGERIVRAPRVTDALGHVLRGAYPGTPVPVEFDTLLRRLDRIAH